MNIRRKPVGNQIAGGLPIFGPPIKVRGQQRRCGSCTACCTLVSVELPEGAKPAGTPCQHLAANGRGCGIYADRPRVCQAWSCRWLFDADTKDLKRPDHGGYVILPDLQSVLVDEIEIAALQVSLDPDRPDAHRDPALRAYLVLVFERFSVPALIRNVDKPGQDAFLLIPPEKPGEEWIERHSNQLSQEAMAARLEEVRAAPK